VKLSDRAIQVLQWLIPAGAWAYWLYFIGHEFHVWATRLWLGAFLAPGTALGFLFERWRRRGDRLARFAFLAGLVPMVTGFYLGVAGTTYQYTAAGLEAAGAIAALVIYALKRRAAREKRPGPA
jgi:hypothetical protein